MLTADRLWKPNTTVAALIERDGKFLLVEEETDDGIRINQPAGHLDEGESLVAACAREALEETAWHFQPQSLIGIYQWMKPAAGPSQGGTKIHIEHREQASPPSSGRGVGRKLSGNVTYLRFAFAGELGQHEPDRSLDDGILRAVWMSPAELAACRERHRSPLVMQCVEDWLAGQRFPLDLIRHYAHD